MVGEQQTVGAVAVTANSVVVGGVVGTGCAVRVCHVAVGGGVRAVSSIPCVDTAAAVDTPTAAAAPLCRGAAGRWIRFTAAAATVRPRALAERSPAAAAALVPCDGSAADNAPLIGGGRAKEKGTQRFGHALGRSSARRPLPAAVASRPMKGGKTIGIAVCVEDDDVASSSSSID